MLYWNDDVRSYFREDTSMIGNTREPKEIPKEWFERDVVYGKTVYIYVTRISHKTKKGLSRKHRRKAKQAIRKDLECTK